MKDQNNSPVQNVELVEVVVTNTNQQRFSFPDVPNIKGKRVTAIQVFKASEIAKSPSGKNLLGTGTSAAFGDAFLTLHVAGREKVKELPLVALHTGSNNGLMKNFATSDGKGGFTSGISIDVQKCHVAFSRTASLTADESVLFAFYYLD